jgi:transposase
MSRAGYPSDVSDDEWAFCAPYLTLMTEDAPQRAYPLREVFNGLRWLARTGAPWHMLPHDLPPPGPRLRAAARDVGRFAFPRLRYPAAPPCAPVDHAKCLTRSSDPDMSQWLLRRVRLLERLPCYPVAPNLFGRPPAARRNCSVTPRGIVRFSTTTAELVSARNMDVKGVESVHVVRE